MQQLFVFQFQVMFITEVIPGHKHTEINPLHHYHRIDYRYLGCYRNH